VLCMRIHVAIRIKVDAKFNDFDVFWGDFC